MFSVISQGRQYDIEEDEIMACVPGNPDVPGAGAPTVDHAAEPCLCIRVGHASTVLVDGKPLFHDDQETMLCFSDVPYTRLFANRVLDPRSP